MTRLPRTICIDLDGTIAHYDGWHGQDHFGAPVSGVQAALTALREAGWRLIIFTTRGNKPAIRAYLESNDIPFDYINENPDQPADAWEGKPIANVYIDDRAVGFRGDWSAALADIKAFRPWSPQEDW